VNEVGPPLTPPRPAAHSNPASADSYAAAVDPRRATRVTGKSPPPAAPSSPVAECVRAAVAEATLAFQDLLTQQSAAILSSTHTWLSQMDCHYSTQFSSLQSEMATQQAALKTLSDLVYELAEVLSRSDGPSPSSTDRVTAPVLRAPPHPATHDSWEDLAHGAGTSALLHRENPARREPDREYPRGARHEDAAEPPQGEGE